ncbi:MAG: HK97 gp10 family phage protein [Lachnospiraceae bacterium]|nr:HK97 gp10 family phage protein [Lachnospiraceae bacterium]
MGSMGSFSMDGMKQLKKQMEKLQEQDAYAFIEACAKELAARLLAELIRNTPVGDYSKEIEVTAKRDSKHHKKGDTYTKRVNPSGKMGGTLRRGWTSRTQEEAESGKGRPSVQDAKEYANALEIRHEGNQLVIDLINPVEYGIYVNFGHRTRGHKGWVPGQFFVEKSEAQVQKNAPKVLEARLKKFLEECIG